VRPPRRPRSRSTSFATWLVLLAVLAVATVACGGDDDDSAGSDTSSKPPATTCLEKREKPTVDVPKTAPTKLVTKDLIEGNGIEATTGKTVTMQYVGVSFSDKQQFDASWDRGQPFPFVLGTGQVIPGWDQGIAGMKVCGRRMLVIPPELGYGAAGNPPIKPNETLVFVVDLVSVQ
jgi:peptidylprolyl isomerase